MRPVLVVLGALALVAGCGDDDGSERVPRGQLLFVERCGSCHTMRHAGTEGTALDLDHDLREVSVQRVLDSITDPPTGMPAGLADGADAQAIAEYVAENRTPREPQAASDESTPP